MKSSKRQSLPVVPLALVKRENDLRTVERILRQRRNDKEFRDAVWYLSQPKMGVEFDGQSMDATDALKRLIYRMFPWKEWNRMMRRQRLVK